MRELPLHRNLTLPLHRNLTPTPNLPRTNPSLMSPAAMRHLRSVSMAGGRAALGCSEAGGGAQEPESRPRSVAAAARPATHTQRTSWVWLPREMTFTIHNCMLYMIYD